MRPFNLFALTLTVSLLIGIPLASAQTRLIIPCPNGVPCGTRVSGHIDAVGTAHLPWVISVAAPAGVCLYILRVSSDTDLIRTVVAPDGTVYRTGPHDPILVDPTIAGWYTVQFDTAFAAGAEQIFTVELNFRAPASCGPPTPGL